MIRRFPDRRAGGRALAEVLATRPLERPVVLGLPRGGVPVAADVAEALHAPLDVLVVRKVGTPGQHELAMGAIGEDGVVVRNDTVLALAGVSPPRFQAGVDAERVELERRVARWRAVRRRVPLEGRTAVVVDDGIATGSTMRAAIAVARAHGAARVVVAAPVAAPDTVALLAQDADEVVVVEAPDDLVAVGLWYQDFTQVTDEEVTRLLAQARES